MANARSSLHDRGRDGRPQQCHVYWHREKTAATSEFDVHIYSDNGGEPGELLHTLTRPNFADVPLNSEQPVTFGTPAGETITLAANTTYFVYAIAVDGEVLLRHTQDKDEDPESNEGWSIYDKCIMYTTAGEKANCDWHAVTKVYYSLMMVLNSPLEAGKPQFSITGSEAVEGSGVQFTVSLSSALNGEATVEYSTSDGTATTADSDYTAVSGTTLTFAANETEKTITIDTGDDSTDEDDESFNVVLSSPSGNAQLGLVTSASGLIINNDQTTQTDGALSSITLTGSDGNPITLAPTFSQYNFLYTATANREIDSLTGVATPSTSGTVQSIVYVGGDEDTVSTAYDAVWPLVPGDNLVKFTVTSPDGSRIKTYRINVHKDASTDATLSDLTLVDNNGTAITPSPAFSSATTEYTASVGAAVTSVTLTGTKSYGGAEVSGVTLAGTAITDDDFTDGITVPSLVAGDNLVEVTVTAEDGGHRLDLSDHRDPSRRLVGDADRGRRQLVRAATHRVHAVGNRYRWGLRTEFRRGWIVVPRCWHHPLRRWALPERVQGASRRFHADHWRSGIRGQREFEAGDCGGGTLLVGGRRHGLV